MRGATLYLVNSDPPYGTNSDMEGNAELILNDNESKIQLSIIGPYVEFEVVKPVDSIYINFEKKRAYHYFNDRRVKKQRLKISY